MSNVAGTATGVMIESALSPAIIGSPRDHIIESSTVNEDEKALTVKIFPYISN